MPRSNPERNRQIVELYRAGHKQIEIASWFGISQSVVSRVIREEMQRAKNMRINCRASIDEHSRPD